MRVLALTRYERLGSTSRLRFHQHLPWLESAGVDVNFAPLWRDAYLERLYAGKRPALSMVAARYARRLMTLLGARAYDLVWLEAEALPFLPALAERALRHAGVRYVVDYDDAVFHKYDDHRLSGVRAALGRKIDRIMRESVLVAAGNDYIAAHARAAGARRVEVVPTVIDLERYGSPSLSSRRVPRVVWVGTAGTAPYLRALEGPLRALCDDGALEVRLIGAGTPRLTFPYEAVTWREETEVSLLHDADIGIMPLPDQPFERGKCGYKLLQYMACALPTVASPVGVNAQIVAEGESGFLARDDEEWREHLSRLSADAALRERLGARGRAIVEESYALSRWGPRLAELLRDAAGL